MTERRFRRFEKQVDARSVTYRLTRYVTGIPVGIEVYVARREYEQGRFVVAKRLLRARSQLRLLIERATEPDYPLTRTA